MRNVLIIGGALVLLGLGVVLWRMTQDTDDVAAAASQKRTPPPAPARAVEAAPSAARDAHIPTAPPVRPQARTPSASSAPAPAAPELAGSAADRDPDPPDRKDLKGQLRKQIDAIDGYVTDCVNAAAKSGSKPKGSANLLLRAFRVKGKTVITEASVEPLDTTIKDPGDKALLDCLAATSKKIQLELPDGVNNILATHQVDLDSGAVVQDKLSALYLNEPVQ